MSTEEGIELVSSKRAFGALQVWGAALVLGSPEPAGAGRGAGGRGVSGVNTSEPIMAVPVTGRGNQRLYRYRSGGIVSRWGDMVVISDGL
jgi:hypothetical protein